MMKGVDALAAELNEGERVMKAFNLSLKDILKVASGDALREAAGTEKGSKFIDGLIESVTGRGVRRKALELMGVPEVNGFGAGDFGGEAAEGGKDGAGPAQAERERLKGIAGEFLGRVTEGMHLAIASMRRSIGPTAAYSSSPQAREALQLSALNKDPLEAQMLRIQIQILDALQEAVRRITQRDNRVPAAAAAGPAAFAPWVGGWG
jgi:hypothetical protein